MTQLEAFQAWVRYYRDGVQGGLGPPDRVADRVAAVKAMREIVTMAQNGPPQGHGDGSFTPASWSLARDLVACFALVDKLEAEIRATMDRFVAGDFPALQRDPGSDDDLPF